MPKSKKTTVFVYYDGDHGDSAVFSTLEKAKAYAESAWEMEDEEGDGYGEWEDCGRGNWQRGEYQHVWTRIIDEDSRS